MEFCLYTVCELHKMDYVRKIIWKVIVLRYQVDKTNIKNNEHYQFFYNISSVMAKALSYIVCIAS